MFRHFIIWALISLFAAEGQNQGTGPGDLPSFITENEAFKTPKEENNTDTGEGSISPKEKKSTAWLVHLNTRNGHGVQVNLQKLSLSPDANEFLMVAPWPTFTEVKLFTGDLVNRTIRIPNTKSFFLLYFISNSQKSPEMAITFQRYGASYDPYPVPPDGPVKRDTIFEVQLKGKAPQEFSHAQFRSKVKEAMRAAAQRYSVRHQIPFDSNIPTEEMVTIRRVSYCPLEWPDREICTSLEHSIFVSGVRVPGQPIRDYELTAQHLKQMWMEEKFPELNELGMTVYRLPTISSTITWWSLIIGLMVVSALAASCTFWRMVKYKSETSWRRGSESFGQDRRKKSKLQPAKHQVIPHFMYPDNDFRSQEEKFKAAYSQPEAPGKGKLQEDLSFRNSSGLPIDYFGSFVFGSNRAFEDDEETVEFRRQ